MTRRPALLIFLLIVACAEPANTPTTSTSAETTIAAREDFPVTVSHAFGETTIDAPPERVFSISYRHQDLLYQLGVAPVGVREWWGEYEYATWPWGDEARTAIAAEPAVMTGDLNLEFVSAHDPDLIVALYSGITEEEYALLSQIAPVVAGSPDYDEFGTPWREEVRILAAAIGKSAEAEAVITDIERQIATVRAEHPEFESATIAVADYVEGAFTTYGSLDASHQFLTELGFVIPEAFDELAETAYSRVEIGDERADLLDLDVVVWYSYARAEIEAHPIFQTLDLSAEGRSVWLEDLVLEAAFSFQTPLAMEYAFEHLVPMLAAAVDGDPTTPVGE